MWDIFNAIFNIGGMVTLVFGGSLIGVIVWITRKPKVFSSEPKAYWFYTFKNGKDYAQVNILTFMDIVNKGKESTTISASFETSLDQKYIFKTADEDEITLEPNKSANQILLHMPFSNKIPDRYSFHGILKLKPSNNRRLIFFGKKYLTFEIDIPEDQGKIYHSIFEVSGVSK